MKLFKGRTEAPGRRARLRGPAKGERPRARVDAKALAADLSRGIEGEVRFDDGSRALYAVDASNYRQVPIGVVIPRTMEDVHRTLEICRAHDAPLLSRGGGTSLSGQCCNVAVVIDWSKYLNRILALDPQRRTARVQPGVIVDHLGQAANRHGLTFWPDPATHSHCTLGGMLGNNSCGVHAQAAGRTSDNVESMEVVTYDGLRLKVGATSEQELEAIIRAGGPRGALYAGMRRIRDRYGDLIRSSYPAIPRRVSGYNLDELLPEKGFHVARALVGSEGTLATILEAEVRLQHWPRFQTLVVLGFEDIFAAADAVPRVTGFEPIGLEGVDKLLVDYERAKRMNSEALERMPQGAGWLFVEFGGDTKEEADARAQRLIEAMEAMRSGRPTVAVFTERHEAEEVWQVRESGLGATARVPNKGDTWPGWEDSAVPPENLGAYLRDFHTLLDRYGYEAALYGHFGQGCLHCRITFDLKTPAGVRKYRTFVGEAADLVVKYGGSLSGEHGDGQSRAELLPKMFPPEILQAMREFKALWDPRVRMNPGKVIDAYRIEENLRMGGDYAPATPSTNFAFPEDRFSFLNAAERCVGVGKCRKQDSGTMCPSYMVTLEEKHSTRGRAHLLHEMLVGDPVSKGWKNEAVKDALDLCLACKGCKNECPVSVDMATYKAEFLHHYYKHHPRPREAWSFGLIMHWAKLGGRIPGLANFVTQTPGLRAVAKKLAGVPQEREIPTFGAKPFQAAVKRRARRNEGGPRVILFPDTFSNYFHTDTAMAGLEVLEAAGFEVIVPQSSTCCGRPLYDYGLLDEVRRLHRKLLDTFREEIRAGTPFVVLEPSCAASLRDEMPNLMPHDLDVQRLKEQTFTLDEFLKSKAPGFVLPQLKRKAMVHGHCHHKSVLGFSKAEPPLLTRMGMDAEVLDSGCCGMAGSFGFEEDKYEVSMQVGERVLLPKVRNADERTVIIADGFSCKTQIEQGTDRKAMHLAQVIQMGLEQGPEGPAEGPPERNYVGNGGIEAMKRFRRRMALAIAAVGALALMPALSKR